MASSINFLLSNELTNVAKFRNSEIGEIRFKVIGYNSLEGGIASQEPYNFTPNQHYPLLYLNPAPPFDIITDTTRYGSVLIERDGEVYSGSIIFVNANYGDTQFYYITITIPDGENPELGISEAYFYTPYEYNLDAMGLMGDTLFSPLTWYHFTVDYLGNIISKESLLANNLPIFDITFDEYVNEEGALQDFGGTLLSESSYESDLVESPMITIKINESIGGD